MKYEVLDCGINNIDYIVHIADIHIRNVKRHTEYNKVFDKLYSDLEVLKVKNSNFVIYVAGDIAHSKTEMSPELVNMISSFLRKLSDINPTIVILGNHDCNLNNESRLDVLTPIIENINHPNLYYFRDTGIYEMNNLVFSVLSVLDVNSTAVPTITTTNKTKIGLYHGPMVNATTDVGYKIVRGLGKENFDGLDMVLLGDIHQYQILQEFNPEQNKPVICYAGSLIQQSFGEAYTGHGYVIWDVNSKRHKHFEIPNDYGYYTLNVNNGIPENIIDLPKYTRLKIKHINTSQADLKQIITSIKQKYNITDVTTVKIADGLNKNNHLSQNLTMNVRDISVQNKILDEHISDNFAVGDTLLKRIFEINTTLNNKLPDVDLSRNVTWKLKRLEYDNMFAYGEGNKIDFTTLNGVVGLFAPNASGKSSLLDVVAFALFDKFSKGSKNSYVINSSKSKFYCKIVFEINGIDYYIEKNGHRKSSNYEKSRIETDFYYFDSSGAKISLNGEDRVSTSKIIKSYIGTYEDFILTSASLQNNPSTFIDKSQADRKDILAQFLDLDVFEQLYDLAQDDIKEVSALLKQFSKIDFTSQLADNVNELDSILPIHSELIVKKNKLITDLDVFNDEIIKLTAKLNKITNTDEINVEAYESKCEELRNNVLVKINEIENRNVEYSNYEKSKHTLTDRLQSFDIDTIKSNVELLGKYRTAKTSLTSEIEKLKIIVKNKLDKIAKLETHEYNPNCDHCINNPFVKDAAAAKISLEDDKIKVKELMDKITKCDNTISELIPYQDQYVEYNDIKSKLSSIQTNLLQIEASTVKLTNEKKIIENNIVKLEEAIEAYLQNKLAIEENKKLNESILYWAKKRTETQDDIGIIENKIQTYANRIAVLKTTNETLQQSIQNAKDCEEQYAAYDIYLKCMNRDGIPYSLIKKVIPNIEAQTNTILTQMVDFTIKFELDGKDINLYIVYEDDKFWYLDLASGMEKFISSLAIRNALIHSTSLPIPNMLAIDEGLGVLDTDNFNSIGLLFDYLKTQFDFIIIISHIDQAKDYVDRLVTIKKINGFSKIEV